MNDRDHAVADIAITIIGCGVYLVYILFVWAWGRVLRALKRGE